jgi:serine/threonine protein kinase
MQLLRGRSGEYSLTSNVPFAFGRSSLLFDACTREGASVAVKIFRGDPGGDRKEEFFNELRAQRTLSHPNILPVLDFGSSTKGPGTGPFVVLPKCPFGNLRQRMRAHGRDFFPITLAAEILLPIARAVDYAHAQGVIHGDIKPENILFTQDWMPWLSDFGGAKYFPVEERVSTVIPGEGGGAGTTAYMSPEQIQDGVQSPRSDIYSLGILAFELLTGSLPFDVRETPYRQMSAKIAGRLYQPGSLNHLLSVGTCAVLMTALSTNRAERPASAKAFVEALVDGGQNTTVEPNDGQIFVSYSHKDEKWLRKLESFLKPFIREHRLALWSDRKLAAGSKWRAEIEAAVNSARVAVFLVSPQFLASDFIVENELAPLLAAAKSRRLKILWIAVSASLYEKSPLAQFQAINDPGRPLDCLSSSALNKELVSIARTIESSV